MRSFEKWLEIC